MCPFKSGEGVEMDPIIENRNDPDYTGRVFVLHIDNDSLAIPALLAYADAAAACEATLLADAVYDLVDELETTPIPEVLPSFN
jgi:hypothetical protein